MYEYKAARHPGACGGFLAESFGSTMPPTRKLYYLPTSGGFACGATALSVICGLLLLQANC
jgi:hypothetical protein